MSRVYLSQARMLNTRGVPKRKPGGGRWGTGDRSAVVSMIYDIDGGV